jgi:hypothetical protein
VEWVVPRYNRSHHTYVPPSFIITMNPRFHLKESINFHTIYMFEQ